MWAILSLLVENKPGILFKVTHMFRSRNFNIDSISVGVTDNPEFSRMTITTIGVEKQVAQIEKQLDKLIDTIEVRQLDEHKTLYS
jgi:acetolactate synthase-1/3 small subunit